MSVQHPVVCVIEVIINTVYATLLYVLSSNKGEYIKCCVDCIYSNLHFIRMFFYVIVSYVFAVSCCNCVCLIMLTVYLYIVE
jgi:hypothetical protein